MTDAELILLAIMHGVARYEVYTSELCFNSIRYSVDKKMPVELSPVIREELCEVLSKKGLAEFS